MQNGSYIHPPAPCSIHHILTRNHNNHRRHYRGGQHRSDIEKRRHYSQSTHGLLPQWSQRQHRLPQPLPGIRHAHPRPIPTRRTAPIQRTTQRRQPQQQRQPNPLQGAPIEEVRHFVRERTAKFFVGSELAVMEGRISSYGVCSNGLSLPRSHPLHLGWEDLLVAASDVVKEVCGSIDVFFTRPLTCYPDQETGTGKPFQLLDYQIASSLDPSSTTDTNIKPTTQWNHINTQRHHVTLRRKPPPQSPALPQPSPHHPRTRHPRWMQTPPVHGPRSRLEPHQR